MSVRKTLLGAAWLPVCIAVVFAVGDFDFGPDGLPHWMTLAAFFLLMWLFGMPLAFAVRTLLRHSVALAYGVAVVGAPLSVWMFFLSVPLPSFLNASLVGLLAWLVAGCIALADR